MTRVPAAIEVVAAPPSSATVGTETQVSVRIVDADGAAVPARLVTFVITQGAGAVAPASIATDSDGIAATMFTVATVPGASDLSVIVAGLEPVVIPVTAIAGPAAGISFSQPLLRLPPSLDSLIVTSAVRDAYDNPLSTPTTWLVRDPTLVDVVTRPQGGVILRVLRRPGDTYLVATAGSASDSMRVAVQDASSPCLFVADPVTLAVGETVRFDDDGVTCVRAEAAGSEYAVVVHHNSAVANAARTIGIVGNGVVTPGAIDFARDDRDFARDAYAFEDRLRALEYREMFERTVGARPVRNRANTSPPANIPAVGDFRTFNVNAIDFCENPSPRLFRAAVVSEHVIVYADVANPTAGFSDAEYLAIAQEIDTLVVPTLESSFGAFGDYDYNFRVILLFTRAVNELASPVALSSVLGFFFARDLLPPAGVPDACAGSNFGEMMYLMVPDPAGEISGTVIAKDFARRTTISTVAHEMQHLINASRRLSFTSTTRPPQEETWLNEGMSHIAEELVFYAASGAGPRQNIDGAQLAAGTPLRVSFDSYLRPNFERYRAHLVNPNGTSPLAANDLLGTRGAAWSFLRYVADQTRAEDGDFWRRLVDAPTTGASNLDALLATSGLTTLQALENWALSVIADDVVPSDRASVQQPSWNFRSAMAEIGSPLNFALAPATLLEGVTSLVGLINGGSGYMRFAVPLNQEALIRVSGQGLVPPGVHLTIVRIK